MKKLLPFVLKRISIPLIFPLLLFIVAVFYGYSYYNLSQELSELRANPRLLADKEAQQLVIEVGKFMALPTGESPTVATVTDVEKLKKQPLFAKAANGDKLLIYSEAKKAILYRPNEEKVIDVVAVNIGGVATSITPVVAAATEVIRHSIALYNGTKVDGVTSQAESTLKVKFPNIDIVSKENAKSNTYTRTLVIDIKGNQQKVAEQMATTLSGQVGKLPPGELRPQADFLIIVGK